MPNVGENDFGELSNPRDDCGDARKSVNFCPDRDALIGLIAGRVYCKCILYVYIRIRV